MTPKAAQFLDRIASWAQNRDDVNLILCSARRRERTIPPTNSRTSTSCWVASNHAATSTTAIGLERFGTPLLTFVEPTATGGELERRVLFANGLDVDVSLIAMATLRMWAAHGCRPTSFP